LIIWSPCAWLHVVGNEADYDRRNLCIFDTCALVYPVPRDGELLASRCSRCDGTILDWPDRASILRLARRLNAIRAAAR
jgi:hypothetical protein